MALLRRYLAGAADLVSARLRYSRARSQMTRSGLLQRFLLIVHETLSGRCWRIGRGGLALARDLMMRRADRRQAEALR